MAPSYNTGLKQESRKWLGRRKFEEHFVPPPPLKFFHTWKAYPVTDKSPPIVFISRIPIAWFALYIWNPVFVINEFPYIWCQIRWHSPREKDKKKRFSILANCLVNGYSDRLEIRWGTSEDKSRRCTSLTWALRCALVMLYQILFKFLYFMQGPSLRRLFSSGRLSWGAIVTGILFAGADIERGGGGRLS